MQDNVQASTLTLRQMSELPGFPAHVTLKRYAAAGRLTGALALAQAGTRGRTYDVEAVRRILQLPQPQPPAPALPPASIPASPSLIPDLLERMGRMESGLNAVRACLEDLTQTRKALQLKYDAEVTALREQIAQLQARERSQASAALLEARLAQAISAITQLLATLPHPRG